MNIITGYRGEPHITSQQKRNINIGIFGSGAHIIKGVGAELSATVISANEVEIADGMIMCEGCTSEIARGTTESMTIDNGTQGKLRIDLIVARYNRNTSTGVEDMALIVIKGTPSASDPQSPAYISGSISDGDTTVDFPIYQVNIDGISITSVDPLIDTVSIPGAIGDLADRVDVLYDDALSMRIALDRDNVTINAGRAFVWFGAHVNIPGYRALAISGTRLYDATQGGEYSANCGFNFCELHNDGLNDDIDFAIRNNGPAAAKIRYRIVILYRKVRS